MIRRFLNWPGTVSCFSRNSGTQNECVTSSEVSTKCTRRLTGKLSSRGSDPKLGIFKGPRPLSGSNIDREFIWSGSRRLLEDSSAQIAKIQHYHQGNDRPGYFQGRISMEIGAFTFITLAPPKHKNTVQKDTHDQHIQEGDHVDVEAK